jgi:hypothetical protein
MVVTPFSPPLIQLFQQDLDLGPVAEIFKSTSGTLLQQI